MKNLKKRFTACLILLLLSNSIVLAKPNYSYTINANTNSQVHTQSWLPNEDILIQNDSNQIVQKDTNTVLTGSVTKSNSFDGKTISDLDAKFFVSVIGETLKKNANIDKNMRFTYSKEKIDNATTAITGTITIYRGIIDNCEYEDELAFIIGHEIAHAADYDCLKGTAVDLASSAATGFTTKAIYNKTENTALALIGGLTVGLAGFYGTKQYSRVNEKDADLMAVDYLVKSGYNPLAGISILYKIGENYADFFSTHPSTDKRIANIYKYIKTNYPQYLQQSFDTDAYAYAIYLMNISYK